MSVKIYEKMLMDHINRTNDYRSLISELESLTDISEDTVQEIEKHKLQLADFERSQSMFLVEFHEMFGPKMLKND